MLNCDTFYKSLQESGVNFFSGVPDSLLKEICTCITLKSDPSNHIIAANEGASVALAVGNYLATGDVPLVYMQNSGLGNTVNPVLSLADPDVYSVPMLMMIGWRGEPGVKDEPQHVKQGKVTLTMLESMGIPYEILPLDIDGAVDVVKDLVAKARESSGPVALIVRKGTFEKYSGSLGSREHYEMNREEALECILSELDNDEVIVSTTGKCSREIYEYRRRNNEGHSRDFLTVGSMGHCSQIALGIALAKPDRKVVCIDGDGAVIMHMGSLAVSGNSGAKNLLHILINNGAHDSVGGQPTLGFDIDFPKIAEACGYQQTISVSTDAELRAAIKQVEGNVVPTLIEVKTRVGARDDLGRPKTTPVENKNDFMNFLR